MGAGCGDHESARSALLERIEKNYGRKLFFSSDPVKPTPSAGLATPTARPEITLPEEPSDGKIQWQESHKATPKKAKALATASIAYQTALAALRRTQTAQQKAELRALAAGKTTAPKGSPPLSFERRTKPRVDVNPPKSTRTHHTLAGAPATARPLTFLATATAAAAAATTAHRTTKGL